MSSPPTSQRHLVLSLGSFLLEIVTLILPKNAFPFIRHVISFVVLLFVFSVSPPAPVLMCTCTCLCDIPIVCLGDAAIVTKSIPLPGHGAWLSDSRSRMFHATPPHHQRARDTGSCCCPIAMPPKAISNFVVALNTRASPLEVCRRNMRVHASCLIYTPFQILVTCRISDRHRSDV